MKKLIQRYSSIFSLKTNLEKEIEDVESLINEYSNLLGEKIRSNEKLAADDPEFLSFKSKFEGDTGAKTTKNTDNKSEDKTADVATEDVTEDATEDTAEDTAEDATEDKNKAKKIKDKAVDSKKKSDKKKKSKKGLSDKWYNLNEIHVYNGMGVKGELELYFKAVDEQKANLENLQRCLDTLNSVIEKGLKKDMGCIAYQGSEGVIEIAFLKSAGIRENFSLKSIYTGPAIPVENIIKIGV